MNNSIDDEGTMNRDEERLWFRNGTIILVVFFVFCGGGLAWSQSRAKRVDREEMRSLLSCFIKPTDVDPRFGLGVGALFAAVANSYLVNSFVPDTGELALADVVNLLGTLTILVTLVESTFSLYLYDICGEQALSKRLDRMSFKVMLGGFLGANLALILAAAL